MKEGKMRKNDLMCLYGFVVRHLTDNERSNVEKYEEESLHISVAFSGNCVIEDALIKMVKSSRMT
jgi:hypothetical protein